MPTTTEDGKVNCVLAQFKTATRDIQRQPKYDTKWVLEKLEDINSKILATKYLQFYHPEWIGDTLLHLAAMNGNSDEFSFLLDHGVDFTVKNNNNMTVLHQIIEKQTTSISDPFFSEYNLVNLTLSAHLKNNNFENPTSDNGLSHFHVACAANNVEVVNGLLNKGVVIDHAVKTDSLLFPGFTSSHFAARNCAFEVLEVLLWHGANIHTKDVKGRTSLHIALEQKLKYVSENYINKLELEKNEKILELLSAKANSNGGIFRDGLGLSQLHVACTFKDSKIAECLLQKVADINRLVNMDSPLWPGYTALHFAALCNIDTVKLLLKKGADISIEDAKGVTPFDICIKKYKAEDIYEVISLNATWKNSMQDIMLLDDKIKLMNLVCAIRDSNQITTFLQNLNENVSIDHLPFWPNCTTIHLAALFVNEHLNISAEMNDQILTKLYDQFPSMLCRQVQGCTLLHLAYHWNNKPVINLLLKFMNKLCPSLMDCKDDDCLSFLHIAAAENNIPLLKRMLSIGSDVNAIYKGKAAFTPQVYSGSTALHFAVVNGSVQAVKLLMKHGADVYAKDVNDMTPIHLLLLNTEAGNLLVSPNLKNSVVSGTGLSHLHIACMFENPECVESLLKDGAEINGIITCESSRMSFLEKYAGYSPLRMAYENFAEGWSLEVLLERGADIFVEHTEGKALVYNVFVSDDTTYRHDFVKVLLESEDLKTRLKADTGMTDLHVACLNCNDFETIEKLLNEGANVNAQVRADSPIFQGYTPLHVVLDMFTGYNFRKTVRALLIKGADVTLSNTKLDTPVHAAFEYLNDDNSESKYSILNMILEAQRDYSVNPVDINGVTHFHIACRILNTSVVEEFLKYAEIDINQPIDFFHETSFESFTVPGYTPLHLTVAIDVQECEFLVDEHEAASRQLNIVDLLLKHGADVHAEDALGDTPIHKCTRNNTDTCYSESLDLFERLARAGADVNVRNIHGNTPWYYFMTLKDITVEGIKTLLRFGCRMNTFNNVTEIGYIGRILCAIPETEVEKFLTAIAINFTQELKVDSIGRTLIHNLVSDEHSKFTANKCADYIQQLSKLGCDVDDQDEFGRTALHTAAKFMNNQGLSALLIAGADVNASDKNGHTAFDYNLFYKNFRATVYKGPGFSVSEWRPHPVVLETLAFHVKKLQLLGLHVNKQNENLACEALKKLENNNSWSDKFFEELERTKATIIGDQSLTLYEFLSETGAVARYPRMLWPQRQAVNKFLSDGVIIDLRKKFPELAGILLLQYRKARARPQLMESARHELQVLLGFELPEICSDHILVFLSNSELKSLIASTATLGISCI